jgi:hypothetical protein
VEWGSLARLASRHAVAALLDCDGLPSEARAVGNSRSTGVSARWDGVAWQTWIYADNNLVAVDATAPATLWQSASI